MGDLTSIWSTDEQEQVSQTLSSVLLEEWGGPRSPLALSYLQNIIIPDVANCLAKNADLLLNPTFADIIAWKLKSQFAYPKAVVGSLTADILEAVPRISRLPQNGDPQEPWRRILRLHAAGKSLLDVEEKTGYPLEYLNLLLLRLHRLQTYLAQTGASLQECLADPELHEFGLEQLSFLYEFQRSLTTEPLFKERLFLEQLSKDLNGQLQPSDWVELLAVVLDQEGILGEKELVSQLRAAGWEKQLQPPSGVESSANADLPAIIKGLVRLEFLRRSESGKLFLTEASAVIIAPFLVPGLLEQLRTSERLDSERAEQILLGLHPEVLLQVLAGIEESFAPHDAFKLLRATYKRVNRKIDLYLLTVFANYEGAADLLISGLGDPDSLFRAGACQGLGKIGKTESVLSVSRLLRDPVAGVREMAAQALGEIGSPAGSEALSKVLEDYYESPNVREQAREALRKIELRRGERLGQ